MKRQKTEVLGKAKKNGTKEKTDKKRTRQKKSAQLTRIRSNAAGIDVGGEEHFVAVPPESVPAGGPAVRSFSAYSNGLDALVEWLKQCGVETVAMESTGVYWIPLYQKLEEAGIEAVLVNARHARNVPGRKTDVKDCQWLQELHSYGLLEASFRPEDDICRLRSLQRHRRNLVDSAADALRHMQKSLLQMNVHLHTVVSDIDGVTGLKIVEAIVAGQHDPEELVKLRGSRIKKSTVAEMKEALTGDYRCEHLFVLRQSLETYHFIHRQMDECDAEIEKQLKKLAEKAKAAKAEDENASIGLNPPPPAAEAAGKPQKTRPTKSNAPKIGMHSYLVEICGVDLTKILGIQILTVLTLLSEIGTDMSRWRNAKAFCSWLGLAPGNKISGGKVLNSRTRKVVNRAALALRLCVQSLEKSDSVMGHFYRRKKAHLGPAKANTAAARKLACLIYHMLKYKDQFRAPDPALYLERVRKQQLARLNKQAKQLGYEVVLSASATA